MSTPSKTSDFPTNIVEADETTHLDDLRQPAQEDKGGLNVVYLKGSTHRGDVGDKDLQGDPEAYRKKIAKLTSGSVEHLK